MNTFAKLFSILEMTTDMEKKVAVLANYLTTARDKDKVWCIALLSGKRPKRLITTKTLKDFADTVKLHPEWLLEESYQIVGDMAEAIALLIPSASKKSDLALSDWIELITSLYDAKELDLKNAIVKAWDQLNTEERFVFNKLITGGFRMEMPQKYLSKALSQATGRDEKSLAHILSSDWGPESVSFEELILQENPAESISKPYPFHLACTLDIAIEELGKIKDWQVERKWNGIRAQLIIRDEKVFVWSRTEELISHKIPEFTSLAENLPSGTVLDGEVICFKEGKILSSNILYTRIGRKNNTKKQLAESPCVFIAYDLLEYEAVDIRNESLSKRRKKLEKLISKNKSNGALILSDIIEKNDWDALNLERENSRQHQTSGLLLKRKKSRYQSERISGDWWKWPVDPLFINAVLLYAQAGTEGSSKIFKEYTFAVWQGENLVSFTKASSGLTDEEFTEITKFVKKNTKEKFGPVRSVKPELVFKLAFDGISASKRHKSGVVLKMPRIVEWLIDAKVEEANSLDDLKRYLLNDLVD